MELVGSRQIILLRIASALDTDRESSTMAKKYLTLEEAAERLSIPKDVLVRMRPTSPPGRRSD